MCILWFSLPTLINMFCNFKKVLWKKKKKNTGKYAVSECPSQQTEPNVRLFLFALHPLPLFHGWVDGAVASGRQLEWRGGWTDSVSWTWGIVFRLRSKFSRGEARVGTVGGAGTDTVREVGSRLHILVASSSENLLLLIKWGGLRVTQQQPLGSQQDHQDEEWHPLNHHWGKINESILAWSSLWTACLTTLLLTKFNILWQRKFNILWHCKLVQCSTKPVKATSRSKVCRCQLCDIFVWQHFL